MEFEKLPNWELSEELRATSGQRTGTSTAGQGDVDGSPQINISLADKYFRTFPIEQSFSAVRETYRFGLFVSGQAVVFLKYWEDSNGGLTIFPDNIKDS